MTTRR